MPKDLLNRIQSYVDNPLKEIESIEKISHDDFYKNYLKKNKPVVITDMVKDWDASNKWSLDFFKKIGANKDTYMAKGNNFQKDARWEHGKFVDFIEQIEKSKETGERVKYLMDIPILKLFPELKQDIDFSLVSNHTVRDYNAIWIGPKGTITGWHNDRLANNILAQIKGQKVVFLVSPKESKFMYRNKRYEPGSELSSIDMEDFDSNKFSLFQKNATVQYVVLSEKQMLFVPKRWWHCVYGTEVSISTNNFGFSFVDNIRMKTNEFIKRKLYHLGLFGKDHVRTYQKLKKSN
ncbi:cupin-like domain-containing protein [Meridianimaribacter flavus]|jgi:lysine-specific demethylase 8|uniref:Lysine-specific demethylase 8 n=1 Tax=Meridianimaribacter flavus TaxID=571115 RepID=A0ABY2G6W7_9FLAO|nr:cupin-like domain-containing protein [Meridianimaribacter flavus]RYH74579.1 cupin-like domain-containing protein [Flavobacteriaceae bacterium 144Ye]TDY12393.1 lysine-specific demethylase 8 [Meridianimaribacter flavus]